MQPQSTSAIILATARHNEFQAEAARDRIARQARTNRAPRVSIRAVVRHRLGITFARAGMLLRGGLTSLAARQRTTLR